MKHNITSDGAQETENLTAYVTPEIQWVDMILQFNTALKRFGLNGLNEAVHLSQKCCQITSLGSTAKIPHRKKKTNQRKLD